jgi:uncharacterized protein (TIGR03085 family)
MAHPEAPLSQRERWALCDLLLELGPDAPTLCEGWRSADLAAHLATRERRPDTTPGTLLLWVPLAAWTNRVRDHTRDTTTWDALVDKVRRGPPLLLRPVDSLIDTIEYFVHHEDLRRAQAAWEPRELTTSEEALLWRRARVPARRAAHWGVTRLEAPGYPPIVLKGRSLTTVVTGPVGELLLWVMGRKSVARTEVRELH